MKLEPISKPVKRRNLFACYIQNATTFLRGQFPDVPEEQIVAYLNDLVKSRCDLLQKNFRLAQAQGTVAQPRTGDEMCWPSARVVFSSDPNDRKLGHSYGNYTEITDFPLFDLINKYRNKIIAPAGTFYETSDIHKSFIATMVNNKKKARSIEKKAMLAAKNCNDKVGEIYHNKKQSTIKIKMNSLPGVFGAKGNMYSSVPNYNAITSTARFCIQNSYAHAERFLESNFYFRNEDQAINHVVLCVNLGPKASDTEAIVQRYGLKVPTADEVYEFLASCVQRYTFKTDFPTLRQQLEHLAVGDLEFVYYMSNMKHIVFENEGYFRPWIEELLAPEGNILRGIDLAQVDEKELYQLDGDLVILLSTIYNHLMPLNPKSGNTITPYETLSPDYNRVDVAKQLVVLGHHAEKKLAEIQDLFDHFTRHDVGIDHVAEHKNMFRDCTILSDTDSIIFTTKTWAMWYNHGKLTLDNTAYSINALAVYWLSKANANILYHLGKILGACGKDILILNMKNEFMMPVEILTTLKKNYLSILKIQEGVFYNTPKLDLKGSGFRGSTLCKESLNYAEWFIHEAILDILNNVSISVYKYIKHVLAFERLIYDSLSNGHTEYLPIVTVNSPDDYKDPIKTIYFNYLLWERVFGDDYGHILLPVKCYVLPLNGFGNTLHMERLESEYPSIATKAANFIAQYPKKDITRIPINPQANVIPKELRSVTDYRAIIYNNCKPLYLLMASFGINCGTKSDHHILFSDIYGWVTSEIAQEAVTHL